jgi:hypothetical protein
MDEELRTELLARMAEDQRIRQDVMSASRSADGLLPDDLAAEWERIDRANTTWLSEVVDARGWPGRSLVGDDGAQAAWLLAQHSGRNRDLERKFLSLLRAAVADGEAKSSQLAYLEDRVRIHEGRPQLYGTQFRRVGIGSDAEPSPIEDPDRLDERRAAVGLPPFAEYEARMRKGH